jgi:hypothetical protein
MRMVEDFLAVKPGVDKYGNGRPDKFKVGSVSNPSGRGSYRRMKSLDYFDGRVFGKVMYLPADKR